MEATRGEARKASSERGREASGEGRRTLRVGAVEDEGVDAEVQEHVDSCVRVPEDYPC